ncbi:MAG TPA: ferredoxin [Ruminococcaceae bacterium]|nr:ferredoxin [Oscillospiraceae bacterium]
MAEIYHSVTLDTEKCKGCTRCIKKCPTEAIRVRNGKAKIIKDRCIDCGECIRTCPNHAKKAVIDSLAAINDYEYTIALPAPSLYGQFNNLDETDIVLNALLKMGFDDVFEVSRAAELVSQATRKYMGRSDVLRPVISSACPVVVRLIRVRFPQLIEKLLPFHPPVELAARIAKKQAAEKTGLPLNKIGAIFISPCPAKLTAIKMPIGTKQKSAVDAVVAIRDVYPVLLSHMKEQNGTDELASSGRMGIGWGSSGGEAAATLNERYLAADGIENVIMVLENLEDEKFTDLDFVELNACAGGCVGGVLTVENPYIAEAKLKRISKYRPVSCANAAVEDMSDIEWDSGVEYLPVMQLDENPEVAMDMMIKIRELENSLCGMDCGSCGAPSCKAYAEDVIRGYASEDGCIYKLREQMQQLTQEMITISSKMPQAMTD